MYAVNETSSDNGGDVSAFSFDKQKGELHFINKQSTGGDDPAYISIDSTGKWIVTANYSGGNISVLPDWRIRCGAACCTEYCRTKVMVQMFSGRGSPIRIALCFRQMKNLCILPDLGNDRIYTYTLIQTIPANAFLCPDPAYIEVPDGSGPRHITFHPNGQYAYVINELSGNVIA